jgi:hypothetical protein
MASRIGIDQARVAAMLLFTLPGTPIFHAGDEIGMPNWEIPRERVRDPFEIRVPGYGLNRDPERTPIRWEGGDKAGFTTGEPWLPISDEIEYRNVASSSEGSSVVELSRDRPMAETRTRASGASSTMSDREPMMCPSASVPLHDVTDRRPHRPRCAVTGPAIGEWRPRIQGVSTKESLPTGAWAQGRVLARCANVN